RRFDESPIVGIELAVSQGFEPIGQVAGSLPVLKAPMRFTVEIAHEHLLSADAPCTTQEDRSAFGSQEEALRLRPSRCGRTCSPAGSHRSPVRSLAPGHPSPQLPRRARSSPWSNSTEVYTRSRSSTCW